MKITHRIPRSLALVVAAAASLTGQSPGSAPPMSQSRVEEMAGTLARLHQAWNPGLNTPAASIELEEISVAGNVYKYRLIGMGLPHDRTYTLVTWPITQGRPSEALQGVRLDDSGQAVCAGTPGTCGVASKPNDPIDLKFEPAKGEPFRIGLISADQKWKAFLKLVPAPNRAASGGCTIETVMLIPGALAVAVEGSGFRPGADLTLDSDSEGERHARNIKADQRGAYFGVLLPAVVGKQRGTTHIQIKSAECNPAIDVAWEASAGLIPPKSR